MTFELLLAFDTDDPEFVRGVEVGRLWHIARSDVDTIDETIHASNAEMAMRIGEATGRPFTAARVDDMWIRISYEAAV